MLLWRLQFDSSYNSVMFKSVFLIVLCYTLREFEATCPYFNNVQLECHSTDSDKRFISSMDNFTGFLTPEHGFENVTILKLTKQLVPILCNDSVKDLPHLKQLYLDSNQIKTIESRAFFNLRWLNILSLRNNCIQEIPPGFLPSFSMDIVDLSFNKITSVSKLAFNQVLRLDLLSLSHNLMENIPIGIFNGAQIGIMNFSNNQIANIDDYAFNHMPYLYVIYFDHNKIEEWKPTWFLNCPHLWKITMNRNLLKTLPSNAFYGLTTKRAITLEFKFNKIEYLPSDVFVNIRFIELLALDGNNLMHLDNNLFSSVMRMHRLGLKWNKLTCFPKNLPECMISLKGVEYAGNPMRSECVSNFKRTSEYFNKINYTIIGDQICYKL